MTPGRFEAFLARLYVDPVARREFLADPRESGARAGLEVREIEALARIDRVGLELAARSFAYKRAAARPRARGIRGLLRRLWRPK